MTNQTKNKNKNIRINSEFEKQAELYRIKKDIRDFSEFVTIALRYYIAKH